MVALIYAEMEQTKSTKPTTSRGLPRGRFLEFRGDSKLPRGWFSKFRGDTKLQRGRFLNFRGDTKLATLYIFNFGSKKAID
jgi:hypothetical protein